ncbi:hypothetical protein CXB51_023612 [Gossypium anomalum]|uniref:Protein BREAKING OF ASYMMETRY IN THE STOMATAL LINEAGE n=1 Tax=Gossypium anomalum TaxID=47600 RepID=A0A8J6CRH5_9ROSI|nr:hypothetical protein CXB51_023612 [Gossypium anomalum]
MCTPSIFPMLVRWSVREFASCFLARRFPEEKLAEMNPSPSLKHPMGHIVAETKDNTGDRKISDKNRKRRNHSRTISKSIVSVDNESENSSWICLPDEEYIVFCFKEDGAFDVMIESNKSERSSWPVNRKGDEKRGSICWEVELVSASLKRLEESRDSYQSDGSTGSFSFPVLGWESMGSPALAQGRIRSIVCQCQHHKPCTDSSGKGFFVLLLFGSTESGVIFFIFVLGYAWEESEQHSFLLSLLSNSKSLKKKTKENSKKKMFAPSILTRLVRWSVRAFASCFLACTFPKEKQAEMNPSPSVKHSTGHIVSETKNNTGEKKINDKNRRQRNHSRTMSKSIVSVDKESENSSWICLPNEEYIVFCIKKDGAYDIGSTEDAKRDELSSDESNEDGSEGEANATKEQGDGEKGTTCCEVELASSSLKRLEESRDSYLFDGSTGLASGSLRSLEESRDSYESDGSTGSFTFPIRERLGWKSSENANADIGRHYPKQEQGPSCAKAKEERHWHKEEQDPFYVFSMF